MKNSKEVLAQTFYNYLIYEQVGRTDFINPFSSNSAQHERIKKDAEIMAEIAISELQREKTNA
jgi:hypothetical protein